jgi:acetylglutamate kinase
MTAATYAPADHGLAALAGEIVVVKYGGHVMGEGTFAADINAVRDSGVFPVVVHGGGPQVTAALTRLGVPVRFVGGLRVTTPEAMAVVQMVLCGQVGPDLVAALNRAGRAAVGLSGLDGRLLTAVRRTTPDLGLVGDIGAVDPTLVHELLASGRIPVIASVAADASGATLNVNADTVAGAVAAALGATRLVMLTDVPGLLREWPDESSLLSTVSAPELAALAPDLADGMVPKVRACLAALAGGVAAAHIVDGRARHAMRLALTAAGFGTMVTA